MIQTLKPPKVFKQVHIINDLLSITIFIKDQKFNGFILRKRSRKQTQKLELVSQESEPQIDENMSSV